MGVTAGIVSAVAAVGSTAYSASQAAKQAKAAQKAQALAIATRPTDTAPNTAALDAQAQQRLRSSNATGRGSTILTGPQGVPNAPAPATKTLLGL